MVAAWRYGLPGRKTYDLSGKTGLNADEVMANIQEYLNAKKESEQAE